MADGDAVEVGNGLCCLRAGGAAGDGEAVIGRDGGAGQGADVEEDDYGGGGLEFLEEVNEHGGSAVRAAGLVKEDADTSKAGNGRFVGTETETREVVAIAVFFLVGFKHQQVAGWDAV